MRPEGLATRIFLDSADPADTRKVKEALGFLDGQTTNPTLLASHLKGNQYTESDLLRRYKDTIGEIYAVNPDGFISIEVPATEHTSSDQMIDYAHSMNLWLPEGHTHIKLPTIKAGLAAAHDLVEEGVMVNMTLVFIQEQAQATYLATEGARDFQVLLSPFIRRLEGNFQRNGMQLLENIVRMYKEGDGHVKVLAASIGNVDQLMGTFFYGADIVTAPAGVLIDWANQGMPLPKEDFVYQPSQPVMDIPYRSLKLEGRWKNISIKNLYATAGLQAFARDWTSLVA